MSKKLIISLSIILIASITLISQGTGTPSTLRVRTDANNSLLTAGATQVLPTTSGVFSSRVLRTDANGNLLVVNTGGASGATSFPASTCAAAGISLTGQPTTGIAFITPDNVVVCGGILAFGGITASEAGFARSGIEMRAVLGDRSNFANFRALTLSAEDRIAIGATTIIEGDAPVSPVACTSPTVTWNAGTAIFQVDVGTACAVSTLAVTLATATNGYLCDAINLTTATNYVTQEGAGTTAVVTLRNYLRSTGIAVNFVDGADIRIKCIKG